MIDLELDGIPKEELVRNLKYLYEIGIALGAERDLGKLLENILFYARKLLSSDAGSIYLVEDRFLRLAIVQNDTLKGYPFKGATIPIDKNSIAGYVASTGRLVNIEDVYNMPEDLGFHFDSGFDRKTGYTTRSMLTLPMVTKKGEIIGVLQLINRKKIFERSLDSKKALEELVVPFTKTDEVIGQAMANQAAVALENSLLYNEIKELLRGFIQASSRAIESRDPPTMGHSSRVSRLLVAFARAINQEKSGKFKNIEFSEDEIEELEYAGILHDFGKIGVREKVLTKPTRLYPEQLELIKERLSKIRWLEAFKKLLDKTGIDFSNELKKISEKYQSLVSFIEDVNIPRPLKEEERRKIMEIAKRKFEEDGVEKSFIEEDELRNLLIERGTLNQEERREMESHVEHSYRFLSQIPWGKEKAKIPEIVYQHHEKVDGSGYPRGLKGDEILIQARMMAIVDIFDALVASDRPYKKALPLKVALKILKEEAEAGHLDKDLVELFIEKKIYKEICREDE